MDPSFITTEPRKRTLSSYVHNQDNISGDRDQFVKRIKQVVNPGVFLNRTRINPYLELTGWKYLARESSMNHHSQTPTIEEIKDPDAHPRHNTPPKNPRRILESSEDNDDEAPPRKKSRVRTKKKIQESSKDEDPPASVQPRKKVQVTTATGPSKSSKSSKSRKNNTSDDSDSEIEIIEKPQESPEKELGMS